MKFLLSSFLLFIFQTTFAQQADIIIKNGKIIDGTGNSWFYADIAIKNGKIISIQKDIQLKATTIIDAKGLIVAPGFIDVHTHIEDDEVKNPLATNFIYDGVTTVVTGNCGLSRVNLKKYFHLIDSIKLSINVASMIGHNDIREFVMGKANREPTATEMQQMESIVNNAMKAGAVGFSTGLIYTPGNYSKIDEIIKLAKVAAQYNGVYATHMRSEGDSIRYAIEEAINIGRTCNMPVEISHFKLSGQNNWGRGKETLGLVKTAREQGLDVTIDQYPYTAASTTISTLFPDWALANGQDSINARLKRTKDKDEIADFLMMRLRKRGLEHFDYAVVANYPADPSLNGKSVQQINVLKGRKDTLTEEVKTIFEIMHNGGASCVFHGMSEDDVRYFVQYPFNMFASDGTIRVMNVGVPHPRSYGTNARVLAKYVREEKLISLEEAIRRMTSLPAQKFSLKNRGLLKEGFAADIIIFNESRIQDNSTFAKPHQYSTGIDYVIVNGVLTLNKGKHTNAKKGIVLYGFGRQ